jgi:phage recombination protein Bet
MTSEIAVRGDQILTTLTVREDQTYWTDGQITGLRHIGLEKASPADLSVFFHQVKRTGLDPFARQIYMIERWTKDGPKQTIQVGIDGFRLIGHREATRLHQKIGMTEPTWCDANGKWFPVWNPAWGVPLAAQVTLRRDGESFTATALFDEYKQVKKDGNLTMMWAQRPAGQIAKCAEALAWRMAFPQDLSGLYIEEEFQHENVERPTPIEAVTIEDLTQTPEAGES